jgi:hypothetical protein
MAAASMLAIATDLAPSKALGREWLVNQLPRATGPRQRPDQASAAQAAEVTEAWSARTAVLSVYRDELAASGRAPLTVARSLLHQHFVRAVGVDPDREHVAEHLARSRALSLTRDTRLGGSAG